jgi:hypothetical protein
VFDPAQMIAKWVMLLVRIVAIILKRQPDVVCCLRLCHLLLKLFILRLSTMQPVVDDEMEAITIYKHLCHVCHCPSVDLVASSLNVHVHVQFIEANTEAVLGAAPVRRRPFVDRFFFFFFLLLLLLLIAIYIILFFVFYFFRIVLSQQFERLPHVLRIIG